MRNAGRYCYQNYMRRLPTQTNQAFEFTRPTTRHTPRARTLELHPSPMPQVDLTQVLKAPTMNAPNLSIVVATMASQDRLVLLQDSKSSNWA